MKVVEKKARGEVIEEAGGTEGARRATGVTRRKNFPNRRDCCTTAFMVRRYCVSSGKKTAPLLGHGCGVAAKSETQRRRHAPPVLKPFPTGRRRHG